MPDLPSPPGLRSLIGSIHPCVAASVWRQISLVSVSDRNRLPPCLMFISPRPKFDYSKFSTSPSTWATTQPSTLNPYPQPPTLNPQPPTLHPQTPPLQSPLQTPTPTPNPQPTTPLSYLHKPSHSALLHFLLGRHWKSRVAMSFSCSIRAETQLRARTRGKRRKRRKRKRKKKKKKGFLSAFFFSI